MIEVIDREKEKQSKMNADIFKSFDNIATSAIESLLLNPLHDAATRATNAFSSAGEAITNTGETILSPLKEASSPVWKHVRFGEGNEDETELDDSASTTSFPLDSSVEFEVQPAVDIQPLMDGTGIELIASDNDKDDSKIDRVNKSDSFLRGSLLVFDPIAAEAENGEMEPMNLKIMQGKNIPRGYSRIRIGVLSREGGAVDQIIGSTPSTEGNPDPIWCSWACSWTLNANKSTKFLFTLLPANEGTTKRCGTICAKVSAADLLRQPNPNFWIKFRNEGKTIGAGGYGRIQIRLTRPTEAILHEQENCLRITPGPSIPRMQSYAIRKMALYSCSPVMLNVYDVSNNPRIQTINNTTKKIGYGGIFHAAIEIQGKEYSFGGTVDKKSKISGVFQCSPKQCPMHHYRESVFLGDCELNAQQVQSIVDSLRPQWLARTYNLFRRNCAFFSRELAIELGVGDIPEWVFSMATTAETIEPYIHRLNAYLKNRTKATQPGNNSTAVRTPRNPKPNMRISLKKSSTKRDSIIGPNESIEAHEVAKVTQEALLDHAMAARIQRSFRASNARRVSVHYRKSLLDLRAPITGTASA